MIKDNMGALIKNYQAVLQFGLIFFLALGLWLALIPANIDLGFSLGDKVLHTFSFFVFALWLDLASRRPFWPNKVSYLLFYGALIECLQFVLPWRSFSVVDFIADALGIAFYWWLAYKLLPQWQSRKTR